MPKFWNFVQRFSKRAAHAPSPARVFEHRVTANLRAWPLGSIGSKRCLLAPLPISTAHSESRRDPEAEQSEE